jgi:LysM repeat protein
MEGDQIDPYPFFRPAPGVPRSGPLPYLGYRVRSRDTWTSIAERFGVSVDELREANHLATEGDLRVGWQILVPKRMESPPEGDDVDPGSAEDGTYVVRAGDTLSEIAERFSIPLDDLARWNDLADPSRIRADMVLVLAGEDEEEGPDEAGQAGEDGGRTVAAPDPVAAGEDEVRESEAGPADEGDVYVVRAGETVSEIAEALGLRVADLRQANAGLDPDRVRPGQELRVPGAGGGPAEERVAEDGGSELTVVVVVRGGDSLWSIARRHDTSVRKLQALNPEVGDGSRLRPGQRLVVPQRER